MPFGFAAAAAAIGGALISSNASSKASDTQANAANNATDLQQKIYQQGRADLLPWQQAGGASLRELMWEMGLDPNSASGFPGGAAGQPGAAPGGQPGAPGSPTPMPVIGGGGDPSGLHAVGASLGVPAGSVGTGTDTIRHLSGGLGSIFGGGFNIGNILTGDVPGGVGLRDIAAGNLLPSTTFGPPSPGAISGVSMPSNSSPVPNPITSGSAATSPFVGDPNTRGQLVRPFDLNSFQADPGYQFRLQQGQKAIDAGAAARGNFMSPSTLQELGQFSQESASNEFNNAYNRYNQNLSNIYSRLTGLSGSGENAAGRIAGLGAGFGSQAGENIIGAGNAQAAGQIGQANALNQGIGNFMNFDILSRLMQQQQQNPGFGGFTGSTAPDPTAGFY
jgi:hypothetical protein